ncbi:MAG: H-X9-DG-CTERM domain-containing protein [Thermoguttaceae bacterium]
MERGNLAAARHVGSHHPGGCNFAMGDGSVHFLSENMDIHAYRSLGIRNDGLPLGGLPE